MAQQKPIRIFELDAGSPAAGWGRISPTEYSDIVIKTTATVAALTADWNVTPSATGDEGTTYKATVNCDVTSLGAGPYGLTVFGRTLTLAEMAYVLEVTTVWDGTNWNTSVSGAADGTPGAAGTDGADGDTYYALSSTSVNIPTGAGDTVLVLDRDTVDYSPGMSVVAAEDSTNFFNGTVKTWVPATKTLTITYVSNTGTGSAPTTAWTVNISGGGAAVGAGDVSSSTASVTDLRIAVFDSTSGKLIKEGTATIADLIVAIASGAEVNTGTDNVKIVSTKALTDSDYVKKNEAATITNHSMDGDDNTFTDIGIASLKTVLADADKFIIRNASGVVVSSNIVPVGTVVGSTDIQTLVNKTLTSPVLNGSLTGTGVLDEDDMASDSATAIATQQSIAAYVQAQLIAGPATIYPATGAHISYTDILPQGNSDSKENMPFAADPLTDDLVTSEYEDSSQIYNPQILEVGDYYFMYYAGNTQKFITDESASETERRKSDFSRVDRVFLAYRKISDGIIGPWHKHEDGRVPVLDTSSLDGGGDDAGNAWLRNVIHDGSQYIMTYVGDSARESWPHVAHPMYATSADGFTWTKQGTMAEIDAAIGGGTSMQAYMFYANSKYYVIMAAPSNTSIELWSNATLATTGWTQVFSNMNAAYTSPFGLVTKGLYVYLIVRDTSNTDVVRIMKCLATGVETSTNWVYAGVLRTANTDFGEYPGGVSGDGSANYTAPFNVEGDKWYCPYNYYKHRFSRYPYVRESGIRATSFENTDPYPAP